MLIAAEVGKDKVPEGSGCRATMLIRHNQNKHSREEVRLSSMEVKTLETIKAFFAHA